MLKYIFKKCKRLVNNCHDGINFGNLETPFSVVIKVQSYQEKIAMFSFTRPVLILHGNCSHSDTF